MKRVALRKESVDRNTDNMGGVEGDMVALRKESVDRNTKLGSRRRGILRRSPQGERG